MASLRFNDTREVLADRSSLVINNFLEIPKLFVFLAAPAKIIPAHVSPPIFYSRLLEHHVWEKYLSSCGKYDMTEKVSIHQWRNLDQAGKFKGISEDNPFRVYADLYAEFGADLLTVYLIGVSIPIVAGWVAKLFNYFFPDGILKGMSAILNLVF